MKPNMKRIATLALALLLFSTVCFACAEVEYPDWGFIRKIPMKPKYTEACEEHGTVEKLTYSCHSYALEAIATGEWEQSLSADGSNVKPGIPEGLLPEAGTDIMVDKELYVYLPYGYTPDKQYNVIYVMHGGGDNAAYWLTEEGMGKGTLATLDNMVMRGECEDTIVVTPTFYSNPGDPQDYAFAGGAWPCYFWMELKNDIIPLVESTYSTYAAGDVSEENLIATRDHRAYAGLSMGSATSLNSVMMHCLDMVSWVGSFSGALCDFDAFKAALESDEFKDYPVNFWYNGSGSADMAHDEHRLFCDRALADMSDRFTDGVNFCWIEFKGGSHAYNCWLPHLYNCLRVFFKQS